MDGYLQSTLVANSLQQNANRNNANNAGAQVARTVPHFPPTNKDFNCTEIHTPDGIYPLLHEIFYETIAPQYNIGTRVSVVKVKDEIQLYNGRLTTESSEDEGLVMGASLTITPVKSAALPIPNAASTRKMPRMAVPPSGSSIGTSFNNTNNPGLQILTSPQKLMIPNNANGNSASPYSPYSPSFSATPSILQSQQVANSYQPQQQFASGSYMMSSSHDLGFANLSQSQQSNNNPESITANVPTTTSSSSFSNNNAQAHHGHTSSVSSISSLFGRGANAMSSNMTSSKPTSQLSSSIARSMSNSFSYNSGGSKPKNHLMKTNSTFVLRFLIHENLQKLLSTKGSEDSFLFLNMGSSFIWMDATNTPKEPLSRIVFSKSYPTCHDMNETTRCEDHLDIIIGFSTGDIIWYDPPSCKYVRLNKGGSMVSSPVSMIKWIPGSEDLFIAIFKNGTALIMDRERDDQSFLIPEASSYEKTEFYAVRPHRSSKYNPVSFWKMSEQGLTDIAFSPDGVHLAITGVDGRLRIIDFRNERLTDLFSSYYGKLSCVDWSPDGRYILTGGEDDLVTLWSFTEKRMVARCQGHKSWVTGVAFDRWRCDNETYRFGSVGEDCNLVLWDFSYSALQKPKHPRAAMSAATIPPAPSVPFKQQVTATPAEAPAPTSIPSSTSSNQMERKRSLRNHRLFRGFTSSDNNSSNSSPLLGTSNGSHNSSSFNRFRKRSSRSNNIFNTNSISNDYHDEVLNEEAFRQQAPVIHPVLKKHQAAILLPTTVRTIHGDPCLSLTFKENTLITTDRRGRIRTWGRPQC